MATIDYSPARADDAVARQRFFDLPLPYRLVLELSIPLAIIVIAFFAWYMRLPGVAPAIANRDFVNYWMAGHLAMSGNAADLFGSQAGYFAHLSATFGDQLPWHNWSYPPHYVLLMLPLGLLGYKFGLVAFLAATGYFFLKALRAFCGEGGWLPVAAASPFLVVNVFTAQNGFLIGGLALYCLHFRQARPIVSGIFLGLLTVKPQLGLLFPILLLVERRWIVLLSATGTIAVLVALSAALFGTAAWHGYLSVVIPYQALVMAELKGSFVTMLPSVYGAARLHDIPAASAMLLHMVVAIPVAVLTFLAFSITRSMRARDYTLLTATFLVMPYALCYDLGMLAAAVAIFVRAGGDRGRHAAAKQILLALVMFVPVSMLALGAAGIPIAPLLLLPTFALMFAHGCRRFDGSPLPTDIQRRFQPEPG